MLFHVSNSCLGPPVDMDRSACTCCLAGTAIQSNYYAMVQFYSLEYVVLFIFK
uniref:Uncharacterized protein n=1 Tax=Anguilla anguilla TaxID=7936 RepID=A0A0E9WGH1_ANGAN